jgi:ParB family transcriptional regulator, chromosome partitioning protein
MEVKSAEKFKAKEIILMPIDAIKPDPNQPRKIFKAGTIEELALSIRADGLINAIEIDENNILITGERRLRAAKMEDLKEIPCVRVLGLSDTERLLRQIAENDQREDMNPMDRAEAYQRVLSTATIDKGAGHWNDRGITKLAEKIKIPLPTLSERLKLLELPKALKQAVRSGNITPTLALEIRSVPEHFQKEVVEKILNGELKSCASVKKHTGFLKNNSAKIEVAMDSGRVVESATNSEKKLAEIIRSATLSLADSPSSISKSGLAIIGSETAELCKVVKKLRDEENKIASIVSNTKRQPLDF